MMQSGNQSIGTRVLNWSCLALLAAATACLSGCSRPYGVPGFSQLVAEAPGQTASFQAPDDGTVYVDGPGHPGQARHIVYSGLIRRGEILTVDPNIGKLLINGKPQEATIEGGKSYYQVWYQQQNIDWY
jgi:hypothetical protein